MPIVIKLRKSEFFGYKINEDNILLLVNVYHDHCNLKVIQIGRKIRKLQFSPTNLELFCEFFRLSLCITCD